MKTLFCVLLSIPLISCANKTPDTPSKAAMAFVKTIYNDQSYSEALKYCDDQLKAFYAETDKDKPQQFKDAMLVASQFEDHGLSWQVTNEKIKPSTEIINGLPTGGSAEVTIDFKLKSEVLGSQTALYKNAGPSNKKYLEELKLSEWQTTYKMYQIDGKWLVHYITPSGILLGF